MTDIYPATGIGLSEDILIEVYLKLPFDKLKTMCKLNRDIERICNQDKFWELYLERNYFYYDLKKIYSFADESKTKINSYDIPIVAESPAATMTPYEIVKFFQDILDRLWSKNVYPSQYMLPISARVLSVDQLKHLIYRYPNNFFASCTALTVWFNEENLPHVINQDGIVEIFPMMFWIDPTLEPLKLNLIKGEGPGIYYPTNSVISGLSREGFHDYVLSVNFVSRPHFYLTPKGATQINFDVNLIIYFIKFNAPRNKTVKDEEFMLFILSLLNGLAASELAKLVIYINE